MSSSRLVIQSNREVRRGHVDPFHVAKTSLTLVDMAAAAIQPAVDERVLMTTVWADRPRRIARASAWTVERWYAERPLPAPD